LNRVAEYINYRRKAKKRHGIHSPFIFGISDICLRLNVDQKANDLIQKAHQYYQSNSESIEVTDLGAGSHKLSNRRKVKDIYKISSSKGRYGLLLYKLVRYFKAQNILELGTSIGIGSSYLMAGNPEAHLTTIEGCSSTASVAKRLFTALEMDSIDQRVASFVDAIPELTKNKYDLIFLDGHHDGQATLKYVDQLFSCLHDDSILILDDIRWSADMLSAWNKAKSDERFHVSIDLYRMGILIKRPTQKKEHFTLRF
jgi:predicted O-methyltransferase YrrM